MEPTVASIRRALRPPRSPVDVGQVPVDDRRALLARNRSRGQGRAPGRARRSTLADRHQDGNADSCTDERERDGDAREKARAFLALLQDGFGKPVHALWPKLQGKLNREYRNIQRFGRFGNLRLFSRA